MPETSHGPGTLLPTGGYRIHLLVSSPVADALTDVEDTLRALDPHAVLDGQRILFPEGVASALEVRPAQLHDEELNAALAQTWDWSGAAHALQHAGAAMLIEEVAGPTVGDRFERLRRFNVGVRAVLDRVPVMALHWTPSQRLVDPAMFVHQLARGSSVTDHAVNIRLHRVPDGEEGEAIMDTLGMTPFGLPDLQVHFKGLDPGDISQVLLHYADYVFDKGDVLDDEHLLRGIEAHEEWLCRRQHSLAPPLRPVIDIHPDQHAVEHEPEHS